MNHSMVLGRHLLFPHTTFSSYNVQQAGLVPSDYVGKSNNVSNLLRENCLLYWKVVNVCIMQEVEKKNSRWLVLVV